MRQSGPESRAAEDVLRQLQQASAEAQRILRSAAEHLEGILDDEPIEAETPIEATTAMSIAIDCIRDAILVLKKARSRSGKSGG